MADHSRNLDRSLVQGFAWTGMSRWLTQIVSWAATLVIARLLTPSDYGVFGMAMVYVGFGQIITEAGVATAVIQRKELSEQESAELGGLAIVLGVALAAVSIVLARPLALWFSDSRVSGVVMALGGVFLIRSVQVVPRALLTRELAFARLAALDAAEAFSLMSATLGFALLELGPWSFVLGTLTSYVVSSAASLKWRPHRIARPTAQIANAMRFARQVVTSQVAWYGYTNADIAIAGRVLGVPAGGAYSFAWSIANIPGERVSGLVGRVMPPLFAAVQHDLAALRRYFKAITQAIALFALPLGVGLSVVADEFVPVVLGEKWLPAVAPLRILALYAAFRAILVICSQVLVATGRAQRTMKFNLLAVAIMPPAFWLGTRAGLTGVALVWIVLFPVLAVYTYLRAALHASGMSWGEYVGALWPAARATGAMAAIVLIVRASTPPEWSGGVALGLHVGVGVVAYLVLVAVTLSERLRVWLPIVRSSLTRQPDSELLPVHVMGAAAPHDRLLLVTYHFPPSESVGALRWQKFVRLAAERGWQFDVVAAHPNSLTNADRSRLDDLPEGTRVYGVPRATLWIERLNRALGRLRRRFTGGGGNGGAQRAVHRSDVSWWPRSLHELTRPYFAWVEAASEARWANDAADIAMRTYREGSHRAVITCGPPHMAHLAGRLLAGWTGLPHVMDLRDPWSLIQRLPEHAASPLGLLLAERYERRAVSGSKLVVTNTEPLRAAMAARYPYARSRIISVTNGSDDDASLPPTGVDRFIIAYAGTIYLDRDPRPLFRALARVVTEASLTPAQISIEFMGDVETFDGVPLRDIAAAEGVAPFLTLHAPRPRREALEFLASAAVLVVLPQDSDLAIPAKVFDYAGMHAWVMALAEPRSATGQLLCGSGADVVAPHDVACAATLLHRHYLEFRAGRRPAPLSGHESFSRRHQSDILFTAIEALTGVPEPREEPVQCVAS